MDQVVLQVGVLHPPHRLAGVALAMDACCPHEQAPFLLEHRHDAGASSKLLDRVNAGSTPLQHVYCAPEAMRRKMLHTTGGKDVAYLKSDHPSRSEQ
jgi:hypothetical protein